MAEGRPTLHHLNDSQSMKILWLLEELEIDYDIKFYERIKSGPQESRAPEELKKVHPLGKSPQLVTADGRVIIESSVIAKYLIQTYDTSKKFQGDPATGNDEIRNDTLSAFANEDLSIVMIIEMLFDKMVTRAPFFARFIVKPLHNLVHSAFTGPEFEKSFSFLEKELGDQDYFMGTNPGRADILLSWPFDFCTARGYVDLKKYPALDRWYSRCQARAGWQRSRSKCNGYKLEE